MTDIVVTDEMRQAVYEADCDLKGHEFLISDLFHTEPTTPEERDNGAGPFKKTLGSSNEDKLPHLSCARCNRVWIVMDTPGNSYSEAFNGMQKLFKNPQGNTSIAVESPKVPPTKPTQT
jgi:hypothetical protein